MKTNLNDWIKEQLKEHQDYAYARFQKRIIPNCDTILGVRTPVLRKLAKQLAKGEVETYLKQACDDSYEEVLLQGMVIAYAFQEWEVAQPFIDGYVLKIDNWALCDLFVSSLKLTKKYLEEMYDWLVAYTKSESAYKIRFGVVMLLTYYRFSKYCDCVLPLLGEIHHEDYYVKMAVAWAISMFYIEENCREQTLRYLTLWKDHPECLDDFTYHKAISKILDSKVVSQEEKQKWKKMKRKGLTNI